MLVMPDDLIAFAWSAPMRDLAAKLDMSDVGLKKLLTSYGVGSPPQGYWNKVNAGRPLPPKPSVRARQPGETGRLRIDERFANLVAQAAPIPSAGPFATRHVPEDLEELMAQELAAIGRATVRKTLEAPHRGLVELMKKERRRREKAAERGWSWEGPKFDTPLARRRLRILNAIFLALSKRGHGGDAYDDHGEIRAQALIGDTTLGLEVAIAGKYRTTLQSGYHRAAPDLPATTPLILRVDAGREDRTMASFQEDAVRKLEDRIAEIAANLIMLGERKFRDSLREAEERELRRQAEAERRRQEKLSAMNAARLEALHRSGDLLMKARNIRTLAADVAQAVADGMAIDDGVLAAWHTWAIAEADRIDPVRSGQIMEHLIEPQLGD